MLRSVYSYIQRIDFTIDAMNKICWEVDDQIQPVFSKHVVLAGSGMIEHAVLSILNEYCRKNSNLEIQAFVSRSVRRQNAYSLEKVKELLDRFDTEWWKEIEKQIDAKNKRYSKDITNSINSLKNLRNQIAHGTHNGISYKSALDYYADAKIFVDILDSAL